MQLKFPDQSKENVDLEKRKKLRAELLSHVESRIIRRHELIDALENLDFEVFKRIMLSEYIKYTGSEKDFEQFSREDFVFLDSRGNRMLGIPETANMSYEAESGLIFVNVDGFEEVRRLYFTKDYDLSVDFTLAILHEAGHYNHFTKRGKDGQMGLELIFVSFKNELISRKGNLLNEALNELKSRSRTLKYFDEIGRQLDDIDLAWLNDPYAFPQATPDYLFAIHILLNILYKLVEFKRFENMDEALDFFVTLQYRGADLTLSENLRKLDLDSLFGKRFSRNLMDLNVVGMEKVFEFIQTYKLGYGVDKLNKTIAYLNSKIF